jgi:hypothetical protein
MRGAKNKRDFVLKGLLAFVVLVAVGWGVWFLFFSYEDCSDWYCFSDGLADCDRVKFIGGTDMIFEYVINGGFGDECKVGVTLLRDRLNNQGSVDLEGLSMVCVLPKGVVMVPENDMALCHGLLKEGLQDLIIEKLHVYVVKNLGQLNLEIADLPDI